MLEVVTVARALEIIKENIVPKIEVARMPFLDAINGVLGEDIKALGPLPAFNRSAMDGYAVKARDTFGASESMPALLSLAGEVPMGQPAGFSLESGQAAAVATGAMLPEGSDAVSMVEYTEKLDSQTLAVYRPVGPGENVLHRGDDMGEGQVLCRKGERLTPRHVALLAAQGIPEVPLVKPPLVGIISTGNELVGLEEEPRAGEIRDVNSYALASLALQAGAQPRLYGIVRDDAGSLKEALSRGIQETPLVLISGGSSVGAADYTAEVINSLGSPGIIFHGVSMRPGKPTMFGILGDTPVFGLSGNPASAMVTFRLLVEPALHQRFGLTPEPKIYVPARLTRSLASAQGREDYIRVHLQKREGSLWAEPLFGPAGFLSPLARARGLVKIGQNSEGLKEGEEIEVELL